MSTNTVETQWRGGPWPKGYSPNPSGRPKAALDVQKLAREHTAAAIQTLVDCLRDPKLRVQAAEALLNRAWGRPVQPLSGEDGNSPIALHLVAAQLMSAELVAELGQRTTINGHVAPDTKTERPTDLLTMPPPLE